MRLRVGVVGLGAAWESRHRPALRALADRFEVRAICTDVTAVAERTAREFEAVAVDGFRALASRSDVDVILMLSPDWYGPLPILAACDAGKAVYCASALDIEPSRAGEIRQRVEQSGVAFMAEFPRRHTPATLRLKELIATRLGQPRLLFCHERLKLSAGHGQARPAGAPTESMRHMMELVDWCRYVVGHEPGTVVGVEHRGPSDAAPDYRMMSLDFSPPDAPGTGPLAQISCGSYLPATWHEAVSFRPPAGLQVSCEHGVAFVDLPASLIWFDRAGRHQESLDSERPVGEQLLTQFYRAVTSLVRKMGDLEDAYRALRIVQAARQSREEGRRLPLEF
ncbi:MAG: Gfo/Idh/MocA family oxidoreductase [Pirellulaceae bacterium]|nr:Gfo/Idh/MocA family oxidoreductase [Pirellulaceae bacterium]